MNQSWMCAALMGLLCSGSAWAQWGRQNRESPPRGGAEDRKAAVDEAAASGGKTAPVMPNSGAGWRGPTNGRTPGSATPDTARSAVDINSASELELRLVPGLDQDKARRIVEMRPYRSTDELVTKKVVTRETLDAIGKRITARPIEPRTTKRQKKEAPSKKPPAP